jgi:glycosyltransferase involved in cell wall biosynthesis
LSYAENLFRRKYLFYVYPKFKQVSFHYISQIHIQYLRNHIRVQELDEEVLDVVKLVRGRNILLHPILYTTMGDRLEDYGKRIQRLKKLLRIKNKLGGFETADSDRISRWAVDILNQMDLVIVPSTFAKNTIQNSGVVAPTEVLPHGIPDEFLNPNRIITHPQLIELLDFKIKHKAIFVLHHLPHSYYRKGSDLVYEVMKKVQEKYSNVYLIVKRLGNLDPLLGKLLSLKSFEIGEELNWKDYVSLYDVCDICLVPSRGGGFECAGIEAIARGVPTLVPDAGCFKDYIQHTVPIVVNSYPEVLAGNPIHIGKGFEVSLEDFYEKLTHVIENLEDYKRKFRKHAKEVREKYSWSKICDRLVEILKNYGFM